MTLAIRRVVEPDGTPVITVRVVGVVSTDLFAQLVGRALNTWDSAPAVIKEFGDLVTHGALLQDYATQSGETKL